MNNKLIFIVCIPVALIGLFIGWLPGLALFTVLYMLFIIAIKLNKIIEILESKKTTDEESG